MPGDSRPIPQLNENIRQVDFGRGRSQRDKNASHRAGGIGCNSLIQPFIDSAGYIWPEKGRLDDRTEQCADPCSQYHRKYAPASDACGRFHDGRASGIRAEPA